MSLRRIVITATTVVLGAWPSTARAQAPATAPLVLGVPVSARTTALGGAWVAGRDADVIFSNPAQLIGARNDFPLSMARFGPKAHGGSVAQTYSGGKWSLTLGYGVQAVNFATSSVTFSPYSMNHLLEGPPAGRPRVDAQTALATVGAAVQYKGFKIGAAGKYAADRSYINASTLLLDLGASRPIFGGTAAIAFQNLGRHSLKEMPWAPLPRQIAAGWAMSKTAGPLDLSFFTQASYRTDWASAAAGVEAGYSWIEGLSVTMRAGLRRPEVTGEVPLSLGGAFTADRLTVEYAIRMYDNSRNAHLVTIRWR